MTNTDDRQITAQEPEADDLGRDYRSKPEQRWTAFDRSEAYLDSRPVGGTYNPAAEYGDPDWREPESDAEAADRTAHLDAQPRSPQTQAWLERVAAISEQDRAEVDAGVELEHAQRTHDPDEIADAETRYRAALAALEAHEQQPDQLEAGEPSEDEREDEEAEL